MVMATISLKRLQLGLSSSSGYGMGEDPKVFEPAYIILPAPKAEEGSFESRFADLPSAGIWADRTESDDELLEELGSGWQGFATEQ